MYEDKSPELIRRAILDRITTDQDKREGSQLSDEVAAVAYEVSAAYHDLDSLLPSFYLDEGSGPYIDKQAELVGIIRKPGTLARCQLTVTGKPGATIPAGTPFYTVGKLAFALEADLIVPDSGTGTGTLVAEAVGAAYNVGAREIVSTLRNYSGVESYHNERADGGADPEADADLLARYQARMRKPATSGNAYHYEQWALEVPGVGACRVFGLHAGPGTVKLVVADAQMTPPSEETVTAVRDHVAAEMPIGPELTVEGAQGLSVSVSAQLTLEHGTSLEAVTAAFRAALTAWLAEEAKRGFAGHINCRMEEAGPYALAWTRVGYLLLSIPGVVDFTGLTVNGGSTNVQVGAEQVPVLGEVTLT